MCVYVFSIVWRLDNTRVTQYKRFEFELPCIWKKNVGEGGIGAWELTAVFSQTY